MGGKEYLVTSYGPPNSSKSRCSASKCRSSAGYAADEGNAAIADAQRRA